LAETALAGLVGDLNLIPRAKKKWKNLGFGWVEFASSTEKSEIQRFD
jgi:hypothetical protein